jgi:ribosome-binding ATPase YchF (GTP1/OBG family)
MLIRVVAGWGVVQLITAKPVVYLVNLTKKDYMRKKNKWLPKIAAWVKENGGEPMIPYSVNLEQVSLLYARHVFCHFRMWTGANSR